MVYHKHNTFNQHVYLKERYFFPLTLEIVSYILASNEGIMIANTFEAVLKWVIMEIELYCEVCVQSLQQLLWQLMRKFIYSQIILQNQLQKKIWMLMQRLRTNMNKWKLLMM